MDTRNLATCFGPTVMRSNTALDELTYAQNINEVIETVILFQEDIFPKADPGETEYSFIAITEGKDVRYVITTQYYSEMFMCANLAQKEYFARITYWQDTVHDVFFLNFHYTNLSNVALPQKFLNGFTVFIV